MESFTPKGVCPRQINIDLEKDTIKTVQFIGGCDGNLSAIAKIVQGKTINEVADIFEGHTCGRRPTSCVDQLVKGLKEVYSKSKQD